MRKVRRTQHKRIDIEFLFVSNRGKSEDWFSNPAPAVKHTENLCTEVSGRNLRILDQGKPLVAVNPKSSSVVQNVIRSRARPGFFKIVVQRWWLWRNTLGYQLRTTIRAD